MSIKALDDLRQKIKNDLIYPDLWLTQIDELQKEIECNYMLLHLKSRGKTPLYLATGMKA